MEIPKYIQNKIKQQNEACKKASKLEAEIENWCQLSGFDPYSKEYKEIKDTNQDYGWLAPDGKFYPVDFGEHQAWASQYLLEQYRNGKIDLKINEDPGDVLCKMGFILLHNPHKYNFSVTRDTSKRITNKQKEFLIKYFEGRNMDDWLNKIYQDEI
jgi:hypothetical protein